MQEWRLNAFLLFLNISLDPYLFYLFITGFSETSWHNLTILTKFINFFLKCHTIIETKVHTLNNLNLKCFPCFMQLFENLLTSNTCGWWLTPFPGCLRSGLSWFNWWVSFAPKFQCYYFCESSCLFYLSLNSDFYVSKIMHLWARNLLRKPNN